MCISHSPLSHSSVLNKTTSPDYPHITSILMLCRFKAVSGALLLSSHLIELYFLVLSSWWSRSTNTFTSQYAFASYLFCSSVEQRDSIFAKLSRALPHNNNNNNKNFFLYPTLVYRQHLGSRSWSRRQNSVFINSNPVCSIGFTIFSLRLTALFSK